MRVPGRGTSGERSPAGEDRRASRGAWYQDPFGVAGERWWDGTRWSREVRGATTDAEGNGHSPARPTGRRSPRADAAEPRADRSNGRRDGPFPVTIGAVVEQQLSVVSSPRKPGLHCQVLASRGRVGSISVFGGQMARLTCADGTWLLRPPPGDRRGLTIQSTDRRHAGRYLRRRWGPGGTIKLIDGTEVELRRSRPGRWKIESADDGECFAEVRRSRRRSPQTRELKVTVHSLPAHDPAASVVILSACAVLMLSDTLD